MTHFPSDQYQSPQYQPKAAQATSFSLMLVRCLQDYGLDDVISAVYTPSPLVISRHQ